LVLSELVCLLQHEKDIVCHFVAPFSVHIEHHTL
jgi:hypothetical protein